MTSLPESDAVEPGSSPRRLVLLVTIGLLLTAVAWIAVRRIQPVSQPPGALVGPSPPIPSAVSAIEAPRDALSPLIARAAAAPRDVEAAIALAQAYAGENRLREALTEFRRASRIAPDLVPARVGQGQVWLRLKRPGPAARELAWAVARLPNNAELRLELAKAYMDLRDIDSALAQLRKATLIAPDDAETHRALATGYTTTFTWDLARVEAQRAVDLAPADAGNWSLLGSVELSSRRFAAAEKALRRALELQSDHATANFLLARTLMEGPARPGSDDEAHAALARAVTFDPYFSDALFLLGRWYVDHNQLDLAVATLRRAREMDPEAPRVMLLLGQALVRRGDVEEGRRLVARSQAEQDKTVDFRGLEFQAARNPNPNVQLRLANLYAQQGHWDMAVHLLEKAVLTNPAHPALRRALDRAVKLTERQSAGALDNP